MWPRRGKNKRDQEENFLNNKIPFGTIPRMNNDEDEMMEHVRT